MTTSATETDFVKVYFNRMRGVADSYCRGRRVRMLTDDELRLPMLYSLEIAKKKFKPNMGSKYATYVYGCMVYEIKEFIRKELKHTTGMVSLDDKIGFSGRESTMCSMFPVYDKGLKVLELKDFVGFHVNKLSERRKKIIHDYYYRGLRMKDIADEIGISEGAVSILHSGTLNILKGMLKEK